MTAFTVLEQEPSSFFSSPALPTWGLKEANGITKAINLTTNLTALAVYLINGKVIFLLGLTAGLFSIAGNYLGAKCFDKGGAKFVKPLMLVVLVIFFVKTLSEIMAG